MDSAQPSKAVEAQDPAQPPLKKKKVAGQATPQPIPKISSPASSGDAANTSGGAISGGTAGAVAIKALGEIRLSAALSAVLDQAAGPSAAPEVRLA